MIFTIVGYPADVEETILGPDGVLANADSGKIIVDMTTSEPALAEAKRMQISLPGLALANRFYVHAMDVGYENLGIQALFKVFEKMRYE